MATKKNKTKKVGHILGHVESRDVPISRWMGKTHVDECDECQEASEVFTPSRLGLSGLGRVRKGSHMVCSVLKQEEAAVGFSPWMLGPIAWDEQNIPPISALIPDVLHLCGFCSNREMLGWRERWPFCLSLDSLYLQWNVYIYIDVNALGDVSARTVKP